MREKFDKHRLCVCKTKMVTFSYYLHIRWCPECGRVRHRLGNDFDWKISKPRQIEVMKSKIELLKEDVASAEIRIRELEGAQG